MILAIARDGTDPRLPGRDLAGHAFGQYIAIHLRAIAAAGIRSFELDGTSGELVGDLRVLLADGAPLLIVGADVWVSQAALQKFLDSAAHEPGVPRVVRFVGMGNASEVLVAYLPASVALDLLESLGTRVPGTDLLNAAGRLSGLAAMEPAELDRSIPPVRIRDLAELAALEKGILHSRAREAMRAGVRIRDPERVCIRGELLCGPGVELDLDVIIEGRVELAENVRIGAHSIVANSRIGRNTRVNPFSIVQDCVIGADSFVGPYGRVRPGSAIGDNVQIGNFVEVKNSEVGSGSRINHLAFVGDAWLGANVTIGAGTITCNHDGSGVTRTRIESGAYVGSGTELVAPVCVGEGATIAAGSTITKDVPAHKLTVARSRQATIDGWVRTVNKPPEE